MLKALFILPDEIRQRVYPDDLLEKFSAHVQLLAPPLSPEAAAAHPDRLREMEILVSSWGCPKLDAAFVASAPNLRAVFYGAGTVKRLVSDAMWARGIRITHAAHANAICVAELVAAQVVLSLKGVWSEARRYKLERLDHKERGPARYEGDVRRFEKNRGYSGVRGATVGIIGLSMVGRETLRLLAPYELNMIAYDPFATAADERELGIRLASLEDLFAESNVVSLHAPWLPETVGMVHRGLLERMPAWSTFINSARGALLREDDLVAVLRERKDITALLDVTHPEPPAADSPLFDLPNIILTPHLAGAVGVNDTRRLGECMFDELLAYLTTGEMRYEITRDRLPTMA